jgi:hypothetical protein
MYFEPSSLQKIESQNCIFLKRNLAARAKGAGPRFRKDSRVPLNFARDSYKSSQDCFGESDVLFGGEGPEKETKEAVGSR